MLKKRNFDKGNVLRVWPKWSAVEKLLGVLDPPRDSKQVTVVEGEAYGERVDERLQERRQQGDDLGTLLRWRPLVSYIGSG